jgi:hypothetical protein
LLLAIGFWLSAKDDNFSATKIRLKFVWWVGKTKKARNKCEPFFYVSFVDLKAVVVNSRTIVVEPLVFQSCELIFTTKK